jgi:hypothetical protein
MTTIDVVKADPDGREALRAAHAVFAKAKRKLADAVAAESRGRQLLAEAEAEIESCDRDMAQIVEETARRISIESQGGPPSSLVGDLDRIARIERRAAAVDSCATARQALGRLQGDTEVAKIEAQRVRWRVTQAVEKCLGHHAERLAREVAAAEQIAADLRLSLQGLSNVSFRESDLPPAPRTAMASNSIGRMIRLPQAAVRVLQQRPLNDIDRQQAGNRDPATAETRHWCATAEKLAAGPDDDLSTLSTADNAKGRNGQ